MHLDSITKLLDISNYRAVKITDREYENIYIVLAQEKDTVLVCSGCGSIHGASVHSRGTMIVEDLAISGKRVFLLVPKRKVQGVEDGRIRVAYRSFYGSLCRSGLQAQVYYHESGSRGVLEVG